MASEYLSKSAIKGLNRIGNILIPGDSTYPSFSVYGGLEHADDLLTYAPRHDIKDLGMVLSILSVLPNRWLTWLVKKMSASHTDNGPLGNTMRQLNMGIRGLVFSLYYAPKRGGNYAGEDPVHMVGFKLKKAKE